PGACAMASRTWPAPSQAPVMTPKPGRRATRAAASTRVFRPNHAETNPARLATATSSGDCSGIHFRREKVSTSINAIAPAGNPASTTPPAAALGGPLANESTFLTLLVSQLQNQDPLSPVDSNQFVSQLTSYSQLEQLIGIHQDTTALKQPAAEATATTTVPTGV